MTRAEIRSAIKSLEETLAVLRKHDDYLERAERPLQPCPAEQSYGDIQTILRNHG